MCGERRGDGGCIFKLGTQLKHPAPQANNALTRGEPEFQIKQPLQHRRPGQPLGLVAREGGRRGVVDALLAAGFLFWASCWVLCGGCGCFSKCGLGVRWSEALRRCRPPTDS